jgi:hypothetical protein
MQDGILNKEYSAAQQMLQTASQSLSIFRELSARGFGLEELKSLEYYSQNS